LGDESRKLGNISAHSYTTPFTTDTTDTTDSRSNTGTAQQTQQAQRATPSMEQAFGASSLVDAFLVLGATSIQTIHTLDPVDGLFPLLLCSLPSFPVSLPL